MVPVTGEQLNATGAATIESLNRLVPNAVIEHVGLFPTHASLSMRGVGYAGVESFTDPQVAVYVNGVYQARNATALTSAVDVDAIEVLRGPQGTLYGRNAFAGAVSVRTTRPDMDDQEASAQATLGTFGKQDFDLVVNQPLIEGLLAGRIAVRQHHLDGYLSQSAASSRLALSIRCSKASRSAAKIRSISARRCASRQPRIWTSTSLASTYHDFGGAWRAGNINIRRRHLDGRRPASPATIPMAMSSRQRHLLGRVAMEPTPSASAIASTTVTRTPTSTRSRWTQPTISATGRCAAS